MASLLVVGEALVDVVSRDGTTSTRVGGSPANVARGLAALGHDVELATWVGLDSAGVLVHDALQAAGVSLTPGSTHSGPTLTALARVDGDGHPTYEFQGDWGLPPLHAVTAAHLHIGSVAAALQPGAATVRDLVERLRPASTISYDPNLRPALLGDPADHRQTVEQLVGLADVVKVSAEDVAWLYDGASLTDVLPLFARLGPSLVVGTDGPAPVHVLGARWSAPVKLAPPPTALVDAIGAGDAFMAGLVSGLLDAGLLARPGDPLGPFGQPDARLALDRATPDQLGPALRRAAACAAYTVSHVGAATATRADLSASMARWPHDHDAP